MDLTKNINQPIIFSKIKSDNDFKKHTIIKKKYMKLKTKNISLIIATAIFVFFGITVAVAQSEKLHVEIMNNLKYGVDLVIYSGNVGTGMSDMEQPIKLSVAAGESKKVTENALPSMPKIEVEPSKGQNIDFIAKVVRDLSSKSPAFVKVDVVDGFNFRGTFNVVARLVARSQGKTLKIGIDSNDAALEFFRGTLDL